MPFAGIDIVRRDLRVLTHVHVSSHSARLIRQPSPDQILSEVYGSTSRSLAGGTTFV